jgi:hypothetical protein
MKTLSLTRFGWRSVLGWEIAYFICLFGGFLPMRTSRAMELHRQLFETFPGFAWISVGSVLLGAVYAFVFAWIFAGYFVWMHNSSLEERTPIDRTLSKGAA